MYLATLRIGGVEFRPIPKLAGDGRLPAVRNGKTGRKISVKAIQEFIDKNTYYVSDTGRDLAKKIESATTLNTISNAERTKTGTWNNLLTPDL